MVRTEYSSLPPQSEPLNHRTTVSLDRQKTQESEGPRHHAVLETATAAASRTWWTAGGNVEAATDTVSTGYI